MKESKRKVWRCLSANRVSFSELFDDISLVLNVRRLCVAVDSRISAAKVYDCVVFAWCSKAEVRYVVYWLSCCTRIFNVSLVFSLADCALQNQVPTQDYWI